MKLKKILLGASLATLSAITLASCGSSTTRNTVTPYGTLNSKLNDTVATADNNLSMTVGQYYTQLRKNGYSVVTSAINKKIYASEIEVVSGLYNYATRADFINALGKEKLSVLEYTDNEGDSKTAQEKLFDLTSDTTAANEKYEELRYKLVKTITSTLVSSIYSSSSLKAINKMTNDEIETSISKYIDSVASEGIFIEASDIELDKSSTYFKEVDDLPALSKKTLTALSSKVDDLLLTQAKQLAARKELYKISDEEFIYDEDSETDVKNSNYQFKDTSFKSQYESTYKKYGKYNAVVIQFNSRKEAMNAIGSVGNIPADDLDTAKAKYLELYKNYYSYKNAPTSTDDEEFIYEVNKDVDKLSELPSGVSSFIKDTLEDGQYLTEPRNINNKYVMVLRLSTEYDYYVTDSSKQADFDDFSDEQKKEIVNKIKEDLLNYNTSYTSTVDKKRYEEAEIKIYDPYFENQFYNSYSDEYTLITTTTKAEDANIFSIGDYNYTVEDFYTEASKKYAYNIIFNYFELEFANSYYNKFVDLYLIDDELESDNSDSLDTAISAFNNNENSTYPSAVGLETYLLGTYGYTTKADVLKYYYNAAKALSVYTDMKVFDSWRSDSTNSDGYYYVSDSAKNSFLNYLLTTGNAKYNDIFSINLDHFLINIDDDADGSPDDPDKFLNDKTDAEKTAFEEAVVELAQAIYLEAINDAYKNSSLLDTLKYIKVQYEEGDSKLKSDPSKTWNDYKKYNFLITVEALASSGDITEDSVSNFVAPFKDYVIDLYKSVSSLGSADTYKKATSSGDGYEYENGKFYLVNTETNEGTFATTEADAAKITTDTLCKTSFGYHVLLINSYQKQQYLTYTADDASEYQQNIELTLRTYTDGDDKTQTIKLNISSINEPETTGEECTTASFNQFFIYYVQKANGATTSLDSSIYELMSKLFDEVISTFTSSNFQNYLIVSKLNIKIVDTAINSKIVEARLTSYKNNTISYDSKSEYAAWFDNTYDWSRPEVK